MSQLVAVIMRKMLVSTKKFEHTEIKSPKRKSEEVKFSSDLLCSLTWISDLKLIVIMIDQNNLSKYVSPGSFLWQ